MHSRTIAIAALLAVAESIGTTSALAQSDYWVPIGYDLPAGPIAAIAANDAGTIVAAGYGGLFRYEPEFSWVPTGESGLNIRDLRISTSGVFYAVSAEPSVLLRSTDGVRWESHRSEFEFSGEALQPVGSHIVFAGFRHSDCPSADILGNALGLSNDGGATWTCTPDVPPWDRFRSVLALSDSVLLKVTREGLIRSNDQGLTWHEPTIDRQPFDFRPSRVVASGGSFAVLRGRDELVFVSSDLGRTWWASNVRGNPMALAVQNDGDAFMVMSAARQSESDSEGGIFKSTDGGATWQLQNHERDDLTGLVASDGRLFGSSRTGIKSSDDDGETWLSFNDNLHNQAVIDVAAGGRNLVLVSTDPRRLDLSSDGGNTWQIVDVPPHNADLVDQGEHSRTGPIRFMPIKVARDGTMYAYDGNLLRSNDAGVTWSEHRVGFIMNDLFEDSEGALIAAATAGVFMSIDRGTSWSRLGDTKFYATTVERATSGTLFAGGSAGLFYLDPDSETWHQAPLPGFDVSPGTDVVDVVVDADGRIFARAVRYHEWVPGIHYGYPELLRSVDRGATWEAIDPPGVLGPELILGGSTDLLVGPHISQDHGDTWLPISDGLSAPVFTLDVDQRGVYYAGSWGGGLYRSTFRTGVDLDAVPECDDVAVGNPFPNPARVAAGGMVAMPVETGRTLETRVAVYDAIGRRVADQGTRLVGPGDESVLWEPRDLPAGVYWVQLSWDACRVQQAVVLL